MKTRIHAVGRGIRRNRTKVTLQKLFRLRYLVCLILLGFVYIFLSNNFFFNRSEFVNNKLQKLDSFEKRSNEVYKNIQAQLSEKSDNDEVYKNIQAQLSEKSDNDDQSSENVHNNFFSAIDYGKNVDIQEDTEDDSSRYNFRLIRHSIEYSYTKRFFVLESFLIDGDKNRPSFSSNIDDFLIVALGVGEFTSQLNHKAKAEEGRTPREIPNLIIKIELTEIDEILELPCIVHTNGTYFQNKFNRHGDRKFEGEKGVWISAVLPKEIGETLQNNYNHQDIVGKIEITSDHPGEKSLVFRHHPFVVSNINVLNYIAPEYSSYELVHCTAPVHSVTGYRFLIEYILYHKIVGFDHLHLYLYDKNYLEQVTEVLNQFSSFLTVHDWSNIPRDGITGVKLYNYNTGQRLTMNDCFFRNRGISRYTSFSSFSDIFAINSFDEEFEAVTALNSLIFNMKHKKDAFDFIQKKAKNRVYGIKRLTEYFDIKYEEDKNNIAFQFTSINTYSVNEIDSLHIEDADAFRSIVNSNERECFRSIFSSFTTSDSECKAGLNCGEFLRGKQRFIIRTAKGAINPNSPLSVYSLSEESHITSTLSLQVATSIGFVRRFIKQEAGKKLKVTDRLDKKFFPFPFYFLNGLKQNIETNPVLSAYYFSEKASKKIGLSLQNSSLYGNVMKKNMRYLTFERYPGRMNNQLFTLDWAFRLSKAFKRKLLITSPEKDKVFFIGFPQSILEEENQTALWNTTLLRKNFNFWFYFDLEYLESPDRSLLDKSPDELPDGCVWEYGKHTPILPLFLEKADKNPACQRVHFKTYSGLIHPKRSDTRKYGVGPLYFWSAIKPTNYLIQAADAFVSEVHNKSSDKLLISFHSRSHKKYEEYFGGVCERLSRRFVDSIKQFLKVRKKCCGKPKNPYNKLSSSVDTDFLDLDVESYLRYFNPYEMCNISEAYLMQFHLEDKDKFDIVFASDHQIERVNKLFEKYGMKEFHNYEALVEARPNSAVSYKYRSEREIVIVDMLTASKSDFFHGGGSSTLSQVICFWRLVESKRQGTTEQSNFCQFALLSTGSYVCDAIQCSSVDARVPALFDIVSDI